MNDSLLMNSHIAEYIGTLVPDLPLWLADVEQRAKLTEVPVIRKEAQGLLRFLTAISKPSSILEIGTAIGFSASFLADCTGYTVPITTIENDPGRIAEASRLFAEREELSRTITLLPGDAAEILKDLAENDRKFDFIFLDAAKAQYPVFWPYIRRMLVPGALLVCDNVLQEGSIAESKFTVTRRDRTIHMRMRRFIDELFADSELTSCIVPSGDGMALSVFQG